MDEEWRLVDVNERAIRTYGYTPQEIMGMKVNELRESVFPAAINQQFSPLDKEGHLTYETPHRCKDGQILIVEVSAGRLEIRRGRYSSWKSCETLPNARIRAGYGALAGC